MCTLILVKFELDRDSVFGYVKETFLKFFFGVCRMIVVDREQPQETTAAVHGKWF